MADVTFATSAIADAGTLITGNELTTLPAINLQDPQPTKKWRTSGLSTMYVVVDLGSANAINLVSLIAHNGSAAATWQIRGASSEANLTAAPGYDSGSVSMWPGTGKPSGWIDTLFALLWLTTSQTHRWWRIDVVDAGNTDGYFEAGRLIIDAAWQPDIGLSPNWGVQWIDPGPREQSIGGQIYPTQRTRRRLIELILDFNDRDVMLNNAFELQRKRGSSRDIFVLGDPTGTTHLHRDAVYGLFTGLQPLVNSAFNIFSQIITVEEMV